MLRYRDFPLVAATCIAAYFLILVWPGLTMHFAPDDMQNAYTYWKAGVGDVIRANVLFATSFYRPLGALFYLPLLALFGFNPLPYRIVILVLICVNVWLFYCLARRIANSRETAAFAVLLGCFHSAVMAVYASNAMIYEVLCFAFLTGSLLYYARVRHSGGTFRARELAALAILFICALNSKEMAVVFPAMLILYEFTAGPASAREVLQSRKALAPILVTTAMSAVYLAAKLFGADTLTTIDAYRPVYTLERFFLTAGTYAADLLLVDPPLGPTMTILFWVSLFALAAVLRRRDMLFGVAFAFLSFLPLNFVPPRQGFVLYIPLIGFAIYAAGLIVALLDLVRAPKYRSQLAAVAFVGCLVALVYLHGPRAQEEIPSMLHSQSRTWIVLRELGRLHPHVERGAKVLFADSPIDNDWDIYFIAKLYFGDRTLKAAWVRSAKPIVSGDVHENFDHEFRFEGPTLIQTK